MNDFNEQRTANNGQRVLMIAPTPFFADRGCHIRIYEEAAALERRGYKVKVSTYSLGRDISGVDIERIIKIPWYKKLEAGPSWHKLYLDFFLLLLSIKIAFRYKPDIIHAHLHEGCLIAWPVARIRRKPLVFDYQGSLSAELADHSFAKEGSIMSKIFKSFENFINRRADYIITSGVGGKTDLINKKINKEKITVVNDGIGTITQDNGINLRKQFGIKQDEKIIIYAGALSELEGTDLLIKAAEIVVLKKPDTKFIIYGYPGDNYQKAVVDLGLDLNIFFPGKIDYEDLLMVLEQADFAVAPKIATTEAHGKLYFYLSAGLATVAFDSPLNKEILKESAVLVKEMSAEAFAVGIFDLLEDENKRLKLAGETKNLITGNSWNDRVIDLTEIYKRLSLPD